VLLYRCFLEWRSVTHVDCDLLSAPVNGPGMPKRRNEPSRSVVREREAAAIDSLGAEMRLQYNLAMSFIVESKDQKLVQVKLVAYQRESP
jgi:hypothetical protein